MTKLKEVWLDVIYQIRLAIAEKLINMILLIMPPGHERTQFAIVAIRYFIFVRKELLTRKEEG